MTDFVGSFEGTVFGFDEVGSADSATCAVPVGEESEEGGWWDELVGRSGR